MQTTTHAIQTKTGLGLAGMVSSLHEEAAEEGAAASTADAPTAAAGGGEEEEGMEDWATAAAEEAEEGGDEGEATRERLKADIRVHNVNVTFSRAYLDDKALLRGFRVRRWVEAQLLKLADDVVDLCEGEDGEVERAAREERAEMAAAMAAMGWAPGELPLSFAGGVMGRAGVVSADGVDEAEQEAWAGPVVGGACECLYAEDGGWYPARVVEALVGEDGAEGGLVTVTFLGYDETETRTVPTTHVRPPASFMHSGRPQVPEDGTTTTTTTRKRKRPPSFFTSDGRDEEPPPALPDQPDRPAQVPRKYWMQRFRLFSQFDRGVRLDPEGWFSVTPERVAAHIAERSRCDVVVDLFAGCGGNVIQFALTCHRVLAIDIDATRLGHARHNAGLYGVADRVDFVLGDALALLPALKGKVDVVFMSPPWGGPEYLDQPVYRLDDMQISRIASVGAGSSAGETVGGRELLERVLAVCPNVAVLLPRNVDLRELAAVAGGRPLEVEENWLNYKLKTITVYFGVYFLPAPPPDFVAKKRRQGGSGQLPSQQRQQQSSGKRRRRRGGRKRRRKEGSGEGPLQFEDGALEEGEGALQLDEAEQGEDEGVESTDV